MFSLQFFFQESTSYEFLIHTLIWAIEIWSRIGKSFRVWLRGSYGLIHEKKRLKILCYCPFKIISITKKPGGKKIYNFKTLHGQKYAKNCGSEGLKLTWSCGLQEKLRLWNCGVAVAEQHFLKSWGIAIVEVLPSSCGIAIADSKKSCACPPLIGIGIGIGIGTSIGTYCTCQVCV